MSASTRLQPAPDGLSAVVLAELATAAGLSEPSIVVLPLGRSAAGRAIAIAPDRDLYPASMIKVPIAVAVAALLRDGALDLAAPVTVTPANLTANDKPSPLVPGYAARLDELVELMLTRSDNVATNMLIDVVGRERATAIAQRVGLAATAVRRKLSGALPLIDDPAATGRNTHPAADAARLFTALWERRLPAAEWLHGLLHRQEWNEKLPRGLRAGDRFAHKTGDTDEVTHDGGILETADGRAWVVVVYTALPSAPEGDDRIAAFMRALRPWL